MSKALRPRVTRSGGEPTAAGPAVEGSGETAKGKATYEDLSKTQQLIARRMSESKATAPHFYLRASVDMSAGGGRAGEAAQGSGGRGASVPSFNDMVVKACALALREHPRANGAYRDGRFELYSRVNVGVAVAAEDALVVPTVFDADRKGLRQIATESRALAQKVREGQITPPELSGATFTVSNLGMYGIDGFSAVINPPQAAILAVGAIEERPVVRDGEVDDRPADAGRPRLRPPHPLRRPRGGVPRPHQGSARRAPLASALRGRTALRISASSIARVQSTPKLALRPTDLLGRAPSQQVLGLPVTAFQAAASEKSAATRKTPVAAARASVQSPWRRRQPRPRAIDQ